MRLEFRDIIFCSFGCRWHVDQCRIWWEESLKAERRRFFDPSYFLRVESYKLGEECIRLECQLFIRVKVLLFAMISSHRHSHLFRIFLLLDEIKLVHLLHTMYTL